MKNTITANETQLLLGSKVSEFGSLTVTINQQIFLSLELLRRQLHSELQCYQKISSKLLQIIRICSRK